MFARNVPNAKLGKLQLNFDKKNLTNEPAMENNNERGICVWTLKLAQTIDPVIPRTPGTNINILSSIMG